MEFRAVKAGDRVFIDRMISRNEANPAAVDKLGNSLLHIAAEATKNTLGILELLLSNGWNPNARNSLGASPLHYVALRKDSVKEVASALFDAGADISQATSIGHTPLHIACERYNLEFVAFLLEKGANPNVLDRNSNTPLHAMLLNNGRDTAAKEITEMLIAKGAHLHVKNSEANDPLLLAASKGFSRVCQVLLQHDVDSRTVNAIGNTIIHQAAQAGFAELVEMLLVVQPQLVSTPNQVGNTPLHLAVIHNYPEVAVNLIKKGASFAAKNSQGKNPVELVTEAERSLFAAKHPELVKVLTIRQKPKKVQDTEEIDDICVIQ